MIFNENLEEAYDRYSTDRLRRNARSFAKCFFDVGGAGQGNSTSTTTETETNQQTSVQAGTSATVVGDNNSGLANVSGVGVNGSNDSVSITTADPAIVQSALTSNAAIATEALSTYANLVQGQTEGQLQAESESQANADALIGSVAGTSANSGTTAGVTPSVVSNSPLNGSTTSTSTASGTTASTISLYLGIAVAVLGIIYYFEQRKK